MLMAEAALRAGLTAVCHVAGWLRCNSEDVPALLREPAPASHDDSAIDTLAQKYHADAEHLRCLLILAEIVDGRRCSVCGRITTTGGVCLDCERQFGPLLRVVNFGCDANSKKEVKNV